MPFPLAADGCSSTGRVTFRVRVADCRFPLHDLSVQHMFPAPDLPVEDGPISVSRLDNGEWFVQGGRHRVIRARLRGKRWIKAMDHDATTLDVP